VTLKQDEQDRLWGHMQTHVRSAFDLSYPRLRFLAEKCKSGTRVLNIGVGTGYLEQLLVARGVHAFSLDPSAATIERLRTELNMGERARQGHSQRIPFESQSFDTVIMTEVLEHLSTGVLHVTLDEVARILRPGGVLMGTVPFREDLESNEVMCPRCEAQFHRWGHEQRFDKASLGALLNQHGFRVQRLHARAFPDFRRRGLAAFGKAVFRYVLGRMGEPLVGPNLYFRAQPLTPSAAQGDR
jgi:SAM-dependent methyltransferase